MFLDRHFLGHSLRHIEQSFYVGVDHSVPIAEIGFLKKVAAQGQAGIVDEHLDLTPFGGQLLDQLGDRGLIAHIGRKDQAFGLMIFLQGIGQGLQPIFSAG